MKLSLTINGQERTVKAAPGDTLLTVLRREGYFGVKYGCKVGDCGACAVIVREPGKPARARNACVTLAAQVEGCDITTIEGVGGEQGRGWRGSEPLHALQDAFVETGAIQCGYCTPAMILAAKALLDVEPNPTEEQVRDAISGVICRCSGYNKPVEAILRAATVLRGEPVPRITDPEVSQAIMPELEGNPEREGLRVVGQPETKVDALKLVQGKPAFTADVHMPGMLYGRVLRSPYAHARIKRIDASKARDLPGVHAVLTHEDVPRVIRSTAGQSHPIPGPLDFVSLDNKVRFVGDRVAVVAAETPEIAQEALRLIEVEYEQLPAILNLRQALDNPSLIHDEPDYVPFADSDPERNLAAAIRVDLGDVDEGFEGADRIFEAEYEVGRQQHVPIETTSCLTYWDEDDRLVFRTSTQVPFHIRRMLAPVLGLPVKRIRVIKPRVGGAFGNKQEVLVEDLCAHLTIATGRPVLIEFDRREQFVSSTTRHAMVMKMRTGVTDDGRIVAHEMICLADTGAYGNHALTVTGNTGHKAMALYDAPNLRFYADVVYTNLPKAGAYRGYGVPQGLWAIEVHLERICREMGWDPLEFRLNNAVKEGAEHPMSKVWSEGREAHGDMIHTCALPRCAELGAERFGWIPPDGRDKAWRGVPGAPHLRRGQGVAFAMQGTAIPYLDMGAASIKINDDGSFNLLIGATDLGTGSDTVLGQMAAEVLGCPLEDVVVYSSDTDFTPFDKGAYASSTTYISGGAVTRAAEKVAEQIKLVAAEMIGSGLGHLPEEGSEGMDPASPVKPQDLQLHGRAAWAPDGRHVTLAEVAIHSLHTQNQHQIMAVASFMSPVSPPPFAAQFAQILVDTETGQITVEKLLMAVDCGQVINPITASGQVEGGMSQALGYGLSEALEFNQRGMCVNAAFDDYRVFRADEMPDMDVIFVETFESSHPFGVKSVSEIPIDAVAPAVGNALLDAVGVVPPDLPLTPEKVWRAMRQNQN